MCPLITVPTFHNHTDSSKRRRDILKVEILHGNNRQSFQTVRTLLHSQEVTLLIKSAIRSLFGSFQRNTNKIALQSIKKCEAIILAIISRFHDNCSYSDLVSGISSVFFIVSICISFVIKVTIFVQSGCRSLFEYALIILGVLQ